MKVNFAMKAKRKTNRILIDVTSATDRRLTGIERYTRGITNELTVQACKAGYQVIVLLAKEANWFHFENNENSLKKMRSPVNNRVITEQIWIPYIVNSIRPNFCFFPGFPPSPALFLLNQMKIFRTVYDATMWKYIDTLSWKNKFYMRPLESFGLSRYDTIFTISDFSRKEICELFPGVRKRIINAGCGLDPSFFQSTDDSNNAAEKFGLPDKYILFVGTLEPRKNLLFLLDVFSKVRDREPNVILVLAGREGWGTDEILKKIGELQLAENVKLMGTVGEEELPLLYRSSSALVFPSIYEGFGLPVLEAMAAGTPVVASNSSSIPEVAGDAAILLPPDDRDAWVEAVLRLISDRGQSQKMALAGREKAQKFTWRAVAETILNECI